MNSDYTSNLTRNTLENMFSQDKRFDGRKLLDLREIEITFDVSNKAEGSARVKLGKSEVIVGVKLAPGTPYPDSLEKGNLMVSGDLLPLASPRFESGPPKFPAVELPRLVDRAIRESGIIDLSKLVITPGEKVWTVFIDIYPINDDGNLIDIATIGAVAALRSAKLPKLNESGNVDYSQEFTERMPVSEEVTPLSFSFFKLGNYIILDPTREEEEACDSRITFGISNVNGKHLINSCQKAGESLFSHEELNKIMEVISLKFDEVNQKLKNLL